MACNRVCSYIKYRLTKFTYCAALVTKFTLQEQPCNEGKVRFASDVALMSKLLYLVCVLQKQILAHPAKYTGNRALSRIKH